MAADQPKPSEAFARWWAELGTSLSNGSPEPLARSAWDAATRAAVLLLHREMQRLVDIGAYEMAAASRDFRERVAELFTSPGQWSVEHHRAEESVEWFKQLFRKLSDKQLEEMRRKLRRPGSAEDIALDCIVAERGGSGAGL